MGGRVCWIGTGEDTTYKIAKLLFPNWHYYRQTPLPGLISARMPQDYPELSLRQLKETIDIVITDGKGDGDIFAARIIAIRVQDKHHKGEITARNDRHQLEILKDAKIEVIDILWNECLQIFRERYNCKSVIEFLEMMKMGKVKLT